MQRYFIEMPSIEFRLIAVNFTNFEKQSMAHDKTREKAFSWTQKQIVLRFQFPNKMKIRIRNMFLSLKLGNQTITHLNNRSTLDKMSRISFDQ